MNALTHFGPLLRTRLRQDRLRILIWIWVVPLLTISSYLTYDDLFPDHQSRTAIADSMGNNPAAALILGTGYELDTAGGFTTWRSLIIGGVLIALMVCFTVIRHTRTEEDTGRAELVYSTVVGRHAQLAATTVMTTVESMLTGGLTSVLMFAAGADFQGSLCLGAAYASIGIVFTAVAAVCAQVGPLARQATGMAVAVIGVSYLVRSFGDASADAKWVSTFSPFGWSMELRSFAENRWELLTVPTVVTVLLLALAHFLLTQRDVGMGLIAPRPGAKDGGWQMRSVLGLTFRLQSLGLLGWILGFTLAGLTFGSLTSSVGELLEDSDDMQNLLAGARGELGDAFLSAMVLLLAIAAAAYGGQAVLRTRTDEDAGRAELVLSTAVSRPRWLSCNILFGFIGSGLLVLVGSAALGVTTALSEADEVAFADILQSALVHIPAAWTFVGAAVFLVGLLPRLSGLVWLLIGGSFVITFLGPMLDLDDVVLDASPFTHVPDLAATGGDLAIPVAILGGISFVFLITGLICIRQRDVHTT